MGPNGSTRRWPKDAVAGNPFKLGAPASIRNILPNGSSPKKIRIDVAHTYAICGYGKDDLASCLVFLACRCNFWGPGTNHNQLELAFQSFRRWCHNNGKTSTILDFSFQELKIKSFLCCIDAYVYIRII